jgi:hypothetical protein
VTESRSVCVEHRYRHVVYADLDVGWLADPLWYLTN